MPVPDILREVADKIKRTGEPHRESVRTILSWFDQQRRGRSVVIRIRRALRTLNLAAFPDIETAYIGGKVELRPIGHSGNTPVPDGSGSVESGDPVARIRMLEAANRPPVSVSVDATVAHAITEMLLNDFSQLPVMQGSREVHGIISWRSIGRAAALNNQCIYVRECLEHVETIPADMPLLAAISSIIEHRVVLVRESDQRISGLVTTSDVSRQFRELAGPFLLVGEIEYHMRRLIDGSFSAEEFAGIREPAGEDHVVEGAGDLTIEDYIRLLETSDNWKRLDLNLDGARILQRLHRVRDIRNDVMCFSTDGVASEDLEYLRLTVSFLQQINTEDAP